MILQGTITSAVTFDDGNTSYTVRDNDGILYRFVEASPMSDGKKPLLRGSIVQVDLEPVTNDKGEEIVKDFERRDGSKDQVAVCRMANWFLVTAAKSADEKRNAKPLLQEKKSA